MRHKLTDIITAFQELVKADQDTTLRCNSFVYEEASNLQASNLNKGYLNYQGSDYVYKRNWTNRSQKQGFDFPLLVLAPFDFSDSDPFGENPIREYRCRFTCLFNSTDGKIEDLISDSELLIRRYLKAFLSHKEAARNVDNCEPVYEIQSIEGYAKIEYELGGVLGVGVVVAANIVCQLDYEEGSFKF